MSDLAAIQGWVSSVQSTMSGLASQVQQAAPTGSFASVFSEAQAVLAGGPTGLGGAAGAVTATPATLLSASTVTSPAPGGAPLAYGGTSLLAPVTSVTGSAVVATAEQYLGTPYVWGGSSPSGFDCSGLVQYVYGQLGVSLPRTSELQATSGTAVPSLAQAQPGDLVFYAGSDGTPSSPGHVGIYLGNGEMIDAPQTGSTVQVQPVGTPVAIRRVLPVTPTTLPSAATSPASVPGTYAPLFQAAAARYGVPVSLLEAVAQVESGYNPSAVSSAGAEGLMQIMPQTAAGLGVDPFDPSQAIGAAAQLLSGYLSQYGSTALALAAYNAGPAAVAQYGGVPPYPQTQAYVQAVSQLLGGAP